MDKQNILPRILIIIMALILFLAKSSDENPALEPLMLILVVCIFLIAFGFLLYKGIQEWKKSDDEVLSGFTPIASALDFQITPEKKLFAAAGSVLITGYFLYKAWGTHAFVPACIFCGIVLTILAIPALCTLYQKKTSIDIPRPHKPAVTGEQIAALLLGTVSCGFFCFFCGIGIYHGVWWFVLPPGIIFLVNFTRAPVAAIRSMIRNRQSQEKEPWDQPDRMN